MALAFGFRVPVVEVTLAEVVGSIYTMCQDLHRVDYNRENGKGIKVGTHTLHIRNRSRPSYNRICSMTKAYIPACGNKNRNCRWRSSRSCGWSVVSEEFWNITGGMKVDV